MAWYSARLDRMRQLIAASVKKGLDPGETRFVGFVTGYSAAHWPLSKRTIQGYVFTLVKAWHFNKWKSWVQGNPYLTKEEQEEWIKKHS